jgi:hypothetical protein
MYCKYMSSTAFSSTTNYYLLTANYHIALTQVLLHFINHNYTNMSSHISKLFGASKIHQSYTIKLIMHKNVILFYFKLRL